MTFRIAAIVLILALALGLYVSKTEADRARARVQAAEREAAALRGEVATLAAEAAHLGSPERIEQLAEDGLGLEPMTPERLADREEGRP